MTRGLTAAGGATLATRAGGTARSPGLTPILSVLTGLSFHLQFGTIPGDRKTLAFAVGFL